MVVVTDSNFLDLAPKLRETLFNADFIAIDFEFLGLDKSSTSLHDTTEHRYRILRENVRKYRPCQMGLAFFKQTENRGYQADAYSIPLFQRFGEVETKVSFEAMRFLRKYSFDMNQVFDEGVEYCRRDEYQKFKNDLDNENAKSYLERDLQVKIERLKVEIHEKCYQAQLKNSANSTEEPLQNIPLSLRPEDSLNLKIPKNLSSVEISIVIHELIETFPQFSIAASTSTSSLTVKNLPVWMESSENLNNSKVRCLETFDGISAILEAASMMRKIVVGHNCLQDVMYLFHYFFESLPEDYSDFKRKLLELFPKFIDTKHLAKIVDLPEIGNSLESLGDYFGTEKSNLKIPPEIRGFIGPWMNPIDNEEEEENNYHNAGFDSYITGEVFLKLAHIYVNGRNNKKSKILDFKRMMQYLESQVQNRFPFQLMDVSCCFLNGPDPKGHRPDVIRIVKRDSGEFDDEEFGIQKNSIGNLLAVYQFDMELSKDRKTILAATNTPGSYAFLCEKFSNSKTLALLDELESETSCTFEQRQTSWRNSKDSGLKIVDLMEKSWKNRQVGKMEEALIF